MSGEANETALPPHAVGAILAFRGFIGRGRYFAGIAIALGILLVAMAFAASAMNPTGGGAPLLAIPLILFYLWTHTALLVARLRDAGRSLWLAPLFFVGVIVWFWFAVELIETDLGWIVGVAGLFVLYVVPGLLLRTE